ncbi:MAG TPA: TonB-dependent receptor [Polyangiaceae bacterium]|nr:TonB-dependent receptor [Polyangiaceae bacterium]
MTARGRSLRGARAFFTALLAVTAARAADAPGDAATVTVHGAASSSGRRDETAASTVVAGEELRRPGASAAEVLARVPGVEVTRTGSSSDLSTAAIRGATSAETPVYLAGVRLNDDLTGTADLSTVPLYMIDRVEVYRGNAPLDADRLGVGGAIFFEPRLPSRSEVDAGASFGSFGERSLYVSGAASGGPVRALVSVRREAAKNDFPYTLDDGTEKRRTNADFGATDAWALARYDLGKGARVTTLLHAYDREQGSPGLAVIENERARTHAQRLLGAVAARTPCGHSASGAESCRLELITSALASTSVLTDPNGTLAGASFVATSGERVEEQARITADAGDLLTFGGAATVAVEHIAVDTPGDAEVRAQRLTLRPAATATWHAGATTDVVATGNLECHATRGTGAGTGACDGANPAGRLGILQRFGDGVEARANVGHYVRTPTLGELYGVSAVVRGNPNLASEEGDTVDAGVHAGGRFGVLRAGADLFGFARRVSDLVAYRQNFLGVVVPYNVGRARVLGVELAGSAELFSAVREALSATLLDARDTSEGRALANDVLPFRPRLYLSELTELVAEHGLPALAVDRATAGVRVTHRSSRYADAAGLVVIPEETLVDVEASASFAERLLTARFSLRNVFDARQVDTVGLPLPGRTFVASLEGVFR